MPRSDREDDVYRVWSDRVKVARRYHEDEFLPLANEIEDHWRGKQWPTRGTHDLEHVTVNLIYANTQTVVPQVFFTNPEVVVKPKTDRLEELDRFGNPIVRDVVRNAELARPVIEQKLKAMHFAQQIQRSARDAYLHMGAAKVGWGSQFGKLGQKRLDRDTDAGQPIVQRTPVSGRSSDVQPDSPWVLRVHPRDLWLPPWARTYDEMEYVVHRIFRRLEDVKSDPRYRNTDDLKGTRRLFNDSGMRKGEESQEEFIELWEIHYRTAALADDPMDEAYEPGAALYKLLVLAEGSDKILFHALDEIAMVIGRYPFELLVYAEDPDRIYPKSDVIQAISQQREINKVRSHNLEVVKRQPTMMLAGPAAFSDEKQEEAILRGEPLRIVKVNDPSAIVSTNPPQLTGDAYRVEEQLMKDFRIVTGVGENQQGSGGVDTATEASIIQSNLGVRLQDKLQKTKTFAIRLIEDVFALLSEFATETETVRIEGPKGTEWKQWSGEDIRGRYDFDIDITQMQPPNSNVRKQMAFQFLNLAATMPHYFDMPQLIKQVARTYADVFPSVDGLLKTDTTMTQEQEILALMNGEMVQPHDTDNHAEHLHVLEKFQLSPAFGLLRPDQQVFIRQHGMMHDQMMRMRHVGAGRIGGSPAESGGMMPERMSNRAPTESSIMAGANGGRIPGGF